MRTQSQLSYNMQQTIQWVYSHLSLFSISDFAIMICSIVSSCFGTFSTMTVFLLPHIYVLSLHPLITALCAVKVHLLHYMRSQTTLQDVILLCLGSLYTNLCALAVQLGRVVQDNHTCLVHKHEFKPEESIVRTWEKHLEMPWFRN